MKKFVSMIFIILLFILPGCSKANNGNEYVAPTSKKQQSVGESKEQTADKSKVRISKVTVTGKVNKTALSLLEWNVADSIGHRMPYAGVWNLTYDGNNNLLSKKSVSAEGGYTCDIDYTYDSENHVLSETTTANGNIINSISYTYFSNGEIESTNRIWNNGKTLKTIYDTHGNPLSYTGDSAYSEYSYTYDNNGNILECICVLKEDDDSTTKTKTVYTYDDKGNKLTMDSQTGPRTSSATWTYDNNGNLIHSTSTTDNIKESTITYDSDGKKISQTDITHDGKENTYTWEYNEMGKPTTKKTDGRIKIIYKYDASGNLTWQREPDSNTTYSYEYYANGEVKNKTLHTSDSNQQWNYDEFKNLTEYTAEEYKGDQNHYRVVFEYDAI